MELRHSAVATILVILSTACATSPAGPPAQSEDRSIEAVVLHPIFDTWFMTLEHQAGETLELGDALGSDLLVAEMVEDQGRTWLRTHRGDGSRNEDWYGWDREVLAPIDGEVVRVHVNPILNEPGIMQPGMASLVVLRAGDGTHVTVAHVRKIRVAEGDRVQAGQPIGRVGNDGFSRHPHIHVGAWRDGGPLQIRFDLRAMARLRATADRQ